MTLINDLIAELLPQEGEYSDHPSDAGGKTKFGITQRTARKYAYHGRMQDMGLDQAKYIYSVEYWKRPKFDEVAELSEKIAAKLFNAGVNISPGRVSVYLQKVLNAFNMQQRMFADLETDGAIGEVTLDALKKYLAFRKDRGEDVMVKAINCLQGEYYLFISQRHKANEDFVYGWIAQRIHL